MPDATDAARPEYEIRRAEADDIPAVAALWCEAFPGRRTVDDRARMLEEGGRYGGLETVLVARDPDGLAGALKMYRMEEHLTGVPFPMMGLAAVAVEPSRRRRGLGARLCVEAIRRAVERGDLVSVLYPFRPDYYERLGWGLVGGMLEHRFRTGSVPFYEEAERVRSATTADRDALETCYRRVATRSHGPITRDRTIWDYRLAGQDLGVEPVGEPGVPDDDRRSVVVYDDGGVTGYAFLRFSRARAPGDPRVDIRELVAETESAYRGLLGHLARRHDRWPLARHYARPEERFEDRLLDPRPPGHRNVRSLYFPTARIVRGPMLRLLDVPGALRARRWFAGGEPGPIRVSVRDPQRPENDGPWRVTPREGGGGAEVTRATATREGDPLLETDAPTLARVFAGELRPSDAARIGRAAVDGGVQRLDQAFATSTRFWLLDEF